MPAGGDEVAGFDFHGHGEIGEKNARGVSAQEIPGPERSPGRGSFSVLSGPRARAVGFARHPRETHHGEPADRKGNSDHDVGLSFAWRPCAEALRPLFARSPNRTRETCTAAQVTRRRKTSPASVLNDRGLIDAGARLARRDAQAVRIGNWPLPDFGRRLASARSEGAKRTPASERQPALPQGKVWERAKGCHPSLWNPENKKPTSAWKWAASRQRKPGRQVKPLPALPGPPLP